jgi:cytidylate kinase
MPFVFTISGLHGTGKSTYAARLAERLRLRHVSAGKLFREIACERGLTLRNLSLEASTDDELDRLVDERTRAEAVRGNVVIDAMLGGWITRDLSDARIYLWAPRDIRIERIARRDELSVEEAREETLYREDLERRRFKRFYAIDIGDLSIYDLTLNTGLLNPEGNLRVLESFIGTYMKERGGE